MHQQEPTNGKNDGEASIRSVQIQGLHQRKRDANDDQYVDERGTKTFPETGIYLDSIYLKWQKVHDLFFPTFVQSTTGIHYRHPTDTLSLKQCFTPNGGFSVPQFRAW
jgi:hypothetical protein